MSLIKHNERREIGMSLNEEQEIGQIGIPRVMKVKWRCRQVALKIIMTVVNVYSFSSDNLKLFKFLWIHKGTVHIGVHLI